LFEIHTVKQSYGEFVLDVGKMQCAPGETIGLIGHNGSGKSTFMKSIAGIIQPSDVSVALDGRRLETSVELRRAIGFCPDRPAVYDWMTAAEFVAFATRAGLCQRETFEHFLELLQVPTRQPVGKLSFGNRTKLGLAIALGRETPVMLFDEPLLGLDMQTRQEVLELFRQRFQAHRRSVFIVSTHSVEDLTAMADRVVVFNRGRLVLQASMQSISNDYVILEDVCVRTSTAKTAPRKEVWHSSEAPSVGRFLKATPLEVFLWFGGDRTC
jgi:ABC-2 type transport system ATP-binding protein